MKLIVRVCIVDFFVVCVFCCWDVLLWLNGCFVQSLDWIVVCCDGYWGVGM